MQLHKVKLMRIMQVYFMYFSRITPSSSCGPFVNLTSASASVTSELTRLEKKTNVGIVMDIILSPGVVVGIIVILW